MKKTPSHHHRFDWRWIVPPALRRIDVPETVWWLVVFLGILGTLLVIVTGCNYSLIDKASLDMLINAPPAIIEPEQPSGPLGLSEDSWAAIGSALGIVAFYLFRKWRMGEGVWPKKNGGIR